MKRIGLGVLSMLSGLALSVSSAAQQAASSVIPLAAPMGTTKARAPQRAKSSHKQNARRLTRVNARRA